MSGRDRDFGWEYPPGVTGNEPQITGEDPMFEYEYGNPDYGMEWEEDDDLIDGVGFAEPGGNSALRAATADNPRNLPCPTCGYPNSLTPIDKQRGYQCDSCATAMEQGRDIQYYEGEDE